MVWTRILTSWNFEPTAVAGLAGLTVLYVVYSRRLPAHRRDGLFVAMVLLTLLALDSPIDFLADRYLFSVHMIQHMILILAVAPLLVASAPAALVDRLRRSLPRWLLGALEHPVLTFVVFNADVALWHVPALYEATLHNEWLHVFEHITFAATACLFWWVALAPRQYLTRSLPVLGRMLYVFLGGLPSVILGAIITFAPRVLYPTYLRGLTEPGFGRSIGLAFGLSPLADQELGGLLMWVPGGVVFLIAILGIFLAWVRQQQPPVPDSPVAAATLRP